MSTERKFFDQAKVRTRPEHFFSGNFTSVISVSSLVHTVIHLRVKNEKINGLNFGLLYSNLVYKTHLFSIPFVGLLQTLCPLPSLPSLFPPLPSPSLHFTSFLFLTFFPSPSHPYLLLMFLDLPSPSPSLIYSGVIDICFTRKLDGVRSLSRSLLMRCRVEERSFCLSSGNNTSRRSIIKLM